MSTSTRRALIIVLIALILSCCTISALLGLRSGNPARAASTFFAGLAFSILIWTQAKRRRP